MVEEFISKIYKGYLCRIVTYSAIFIIGKNVDMTIKFSIKHINIIRI